MSIRRWWRKANHDLIDRMEAGVVQPKAKPVKKAKPPRSPWTYRGYWRNAWRHS